MRVQYIEFPIIIERDEDGAYIGEVSQLQACYSEGKTVSELLKNMKEVIELYLEEKAEAALGITIFCDVEQIKLLSNDRKKSIRDQ